VGKGGSPSSRALSARVFTRPRPRLHTQWRALGQIQGEFRTSSKFPCRRLAWRSWCEGCAPPGWRVPTRGKTEGIPCPPPGRARVPMVQCCIGNAARAVPTGLLHRVGPPPWRGDWNHTWQNINYRRLPKPHQAAGGGPCPGSPNNQHH
jgi:hypothetical protein